MCQSRLRRLSGFTGQTKAFAIMEDMLSGLSRSGRATEIFGEGRYLHKTVNDLRRIGAEFKHFRTGQSLTQIENYLRANPKGVMVFGVEFGEGGHALGAKIDFFGKFKIVDRTGKELSTLKEVEAIGPGYSGIANGTIQNTAMYIPQARYLQRTGQNAAALAFELNVVVAKARNKRSATSHRLAR